jgi:hypothetical protein
MEQPMTREPTFRWVCSYQGCVDYEVTAATGVYWAELRTSAPDYALATANGDDVRRDMITSIGILRRSHSTPTCTLAWTKDPSTARLFQVPLETVHAFNRWRAAEHARHVAELESQPHRYGPIAADDPVRHPPMLACAGYYVCGQGWTRVPLNGKGE